MKTKLVGYFDGACRPDGRGSWAWVIFWCGAEMVNGRGIIFNATNNQAEYHAAQELARTIAANFPTEPAVIYGDSQLVIQQVNGKYACKAANLKPYLIELQRLKAAHGWHIGWVPRERNGRADALAQLAYQEATLV